MAGAYGIVMENRKELVRKLITKMEEGYVKTKAIWNPEAMLPYNPFSMVRYRGGNRLRLITQAEEYAYQDPRWGTFLQYQKKGYSIRKGEKGTLCEKWMFEKEVQIKDELGKVTIQKEPLEKPLVSYFIVYNGEQVKDFPPYLQEKEDNRDLQDIAERLKTVSECHVTECAQPKAYYSLGEDKIYLPLKTVFKDNASYLKTLLHEMVHSTGHPERLNRDMMHPFGSEAYAREELRAEIGAFFLGSEMGIPLTGEHLQDHSNYVNSWIQVLKKDYNELFRACADAEKITDRIIENYEREFFPIAKRTYGNIPENKRMKKVPWKILQK